MNVIKTITRKINPDQRPILTADQPVYKIGNYISKTQKEIIISFPILYITLCISYDSIQI